MLKSLHRKKNTLIFSDLAWIRTHGLQNDEFLWTYAYAHAATELCNVLGNYSWCNSEQFFMSNFKPLSQVGTTIYAQNIDMYV